MASPSGGVRVILSASLVVTQGKQRVRDERVLEQLDGLTEAKAPLAEFLPARLVSLQLSGGYLRCVFDPKKREAGIVTEYAAPRRLARDDIQQVIEATKGQWLDGVGESFFDDFCDYYECSVEIGPRINVVQESGRAWQPGKNAKTKLVKPKRRKPAKSDVKALSKRLFDATSARQVEALLHDGADPNAFDAEGNQPLHTPALLRQPKLIQLLLDHGSAVNAKSKDTGETPLMVAAAYGLAATVRLLLAAGASVQMEDRSGATAMDHAVEGVLAHDIRPKPEIIGALLQAGARVTPKTLCAAATQPDPAIVQLVLDAGVDVNSGVDGHHTALSHAVMLGNTRVVKLLLDARGNPNCKVYQQSAWAAAKQAGFTAIARLLKAGGARDE